VRGSRPVVVTGVSSGIGRAIARTLSAAGFTVFGSVRRAEDAATFEAETGGTALSFDIRDEAAIAEAAAKVHAAAGEEGIAALVNNAGIALPGALERIPIERFREQIEIGLVGPLAVTKAFLPSLKGRGARARAGRIINISSVAGATAMPFLGPYSAAKFGLEAMSDSLRRELAVYGIEVVVIQPGGIATPAWEKAASEDSSAFAAGPYEKPAAEFRDLALAAGTGGMAAERVAGLVLRVLRARRPRPRYLITPHPVTERIIRRLPTRLLDRLIARRLGLRPPRD
jgi:NAD(P)-dependent dehydrogenase (short-subunit alcohol dehydrogenase family)